MLCRDAACTPQLSRYESKMKNSQTIIAVLLSMFIASICVAGDIVIIEKRESAENGQSVIAMINGEQVTLKKFYVELDGIRLQPANPDMAPIMLRNDEVQILGIVTGVIRSTDA